MRVRGSEGVRENKIGTVSHILLGNRPKSLSFFFRSCDVSSGTAGSRVRRDLPCAWWCQPPSLENGFGN